MNRRDLYRFSMNLPRKNIFRIKGVSKNVKKLATVVSIWDLFLCVNNFGIKIKANFPISSLTRKGKCSIL